MILFFISLAFAGDLQLSPVPAQYLLFSRPNVVHKKHVLLPHGPDGPTPEDGYEFEDVDEENNFLSRLGLLGLAGSVVYGALALTAEKGTPKRQKRLQTSLGLAGGGVGLIFIDRKF